MSYRSTGDTTQVLDAATAALKVAQDPYLPEVVCSVLRLSALEEGRAPGPPCRQVNAAPGRGIGLRHVVVPIRLAVKARQRPIVAFAVVGGALLGLVAFGYALGKNRRPS